MLKKGSTGAQVIKLQRDLNRLKIKIAGGALVVDGDYGAKTESAVRIFQRVNGLDPDGVVGPKTLAAIARLLKPKPKPKPVTRAWKTLHIMLDTQHVGRFSNPMDRGAEGCGLIEAREVDRYFDVAVKLLRADGHKITRGGYTGVKGDYPDRAKWANANGVDVYLAGHLNSFDGKANYSLVEVSFNSSGKSKVLACALLDGFKKYLGLRTVYKHLDQGERGNSCVKYTSMPAVILEPLFIDNPDHARMLKIGEGHKKIAEAIRDAIRSFAKK